VNLAYLGIDVSKERLDASLLVEGKSISKAFKNAPCGHHLLMQWVRSRFKGPVHACMESTGCYSYGPAIFLLGECAVVSVENPRRIKNFGQAMGVLTKTDKVDARVIAEYAARMQPKPWRLSDPYAQHLLLLVRRISDLDTLASMEGNRLENLHLPGCIVNSIRSTLADLQRQRAAMWEQLAEHVRSSQKVTQQVRTLALMNGMGEWSAVRYLAYIGDPEHYESAEEVAAFCGVYPVLNQSGKMQRRSRMSRCGEPAIRGAFHMPAIVASRYDPSMKAFRERLTDRGLSKSAAIGACKRKLLMRCYGVLKALAEGREPTGLNPQKRIRWDLTR
jgi:transposase